MQVFRTASGRWLRLALAKYSIALLRNDVAAASMSLDCAHASITSVLKMNMEEEND